MIGPCPHCATPLPGLELKDGRRNARRHERRCARATIAERAHWKRTGKWPASSAVTARNRLATQRWKARQRQGACP